MLVNIKTKFEFKQNKFTTIAINALFLFTGDQGFPGEEGEKGPQGDKGLAGRSGYVPYRYVAAGTTIK